MLARLLEEEDHLGSVHWCVCVCVCGVCGGVCVCVCVVCVVVCVCVACVVCVVVCVCVWCGVCVGVWRVFIGVCLWVREGCLPGHKVSYTIEGEV